MARIRVSAELRIRCGDRATGAAVEVGLVRHDPPSQVEHARIVPGTRVPAELRRRSDLRAAAAERCAREHADLRRVAARVWAEATNAHGRDRYSAHVEFAR